MAATVWDDVLDTEHVHVLRTYIERWPRKQGVPSRVAREGVMRERAGVARGSRSGRG